MILNLQLLNEHVIYLHFKMNTLKDAISLMKPNCFMASIDLKDAYYSVPIAQVHQNYLKFQWENKLYAFTCFRNGLAFCPRKFTKLLKPVYSVLPQLGHASSPYIDNSYLQGDDYYSCLANVIDTIRLIYYLGFLIHPGKSVLVPTQRLIFLGFILDSVLMQIYMTPDKVAKVIDLCSNLLSGCKTRAGGSWSPDEKSKHINYLELLAVYLALQSFTPQVTGKHIKVMVDNMTALSDINHMGMGKCKDRHQLVKDIWLWCMEHNVWFTAVHIPGAENIDADLQSRVFNTNTEWTLNKPIFAAAISKLGVSSNIDLFASRLNFQIQPYVSFHPDLGAIAINAFHMSWKPYLSYIFPPFCLISRILQKLQEEKATAVAVIPHWPTQIWWPHLISLLIRHPIILPNTKITVHLPSNLGHIHPLYPQLHLLICLLSGDPSKTKEFQLQLPTLFVRGGPGPSSNINCCILYFMCKETYRT